ncbi:MAG: c-type cytochrome [Pseudomonadota bacterium]|nr:c-type cytochrome [Pseudomonadota bacterium]
MKSAARLVVMVAMAALVAACSQIDRSRAVGNPQISATTMAQQVCSTCHGVTGNSVSPAFPKLAGQQRDYLVAQLAEFKSHNRSNPAGAQYMWGFTNLTPGQVQGLADYFSGQTPTIGPPGSASLEAEGRRIYSDGIPDKGVTKCSACHGAKGEGNAQFPRLAGQHADYIAKQLVIFQRTDQRPLGAAMKQVTHELSDRQIHALAVFLQSFAGTQK